jgi:mannose/fructose/N-acetylgalactosamine-specific phosphotransferase system component IIC
MKSKRFTRLQAVFGWSLIFILAVGLVVTSGLIPDEIWHRLPHWLVSALSVTGIVVAVVTIASALCLLINKRGDKENSK